MLYRAAIALFLCLAPEGHALSLPSSTRSARLPSVARASVLTCAEDPTGNPFIQAINGLQEAIQNSPAAKFKKGLAKLQAGDYDEIAMRAQLDGIIAGELPVHALSGLADRRPARGTFPRRPRGNVLVYDLTLLRQGEAGECWRRCLANATSTDIRTARTQPRERSPRTRRSPARCSTATAPSTASSS